MRLETPAPVPKSLSCVQRGQVALPDLLSFLSWLFCPSWLVTLLRSDESSIQRFSDSTLQMLSEDEETGHSTSFARPDRAGG